MTVKLSIKHALCSPKSKTPNSKPMTIYRYNEHGNCLGYHQLTKLMMREMHQDLSVVPPQLNKTLVDRYELKSKLRTWSQ